MAIGKDISFLSRLSIISFIVGYLEQVNVGSSDYLFKSLFSNFGLSWNLFILIIEVPNGVTISIMETLKCSKIYSGSWSMYLL